MSVKPEKMPRTTRPADKAQLDRFKQTARELGCDETGEAFEKAFSKIKVKLPPKSPHAKDIEK